MLKNLLDWYKNEDKHPNLWSLSRSSGVPKYPGEKPHTTKRKRSRASRQPPKTSSTLCPPSASSAGNSPDPKKSSSHSVCVSQAGAVLTWQSSPMASGSGQSSSFNLSSSPASTVEWPYLYGSYPAYGPPSPWYQQTPAHPFSPPFPSRFYPSPYMDCSLSPPSNLPYRPQCPQSNMNPKGPFTLKFFE